MAITIDSFQPKKGKERPIEILRPVLVQGVPVEKGRKIRVPEEDAHDLVHAGQAKYLDEK